MNKHDTKDTIKTIDVTHDNIALIQSNNIS